MPMTVSHLPISAQTRHGPDMYGEIYGEPMSIPIGDIKSSWQNAGYASPLGKIAARVGSSPTAMGNAAAVNENEQDAFSLFYEHAEAYSPDAAVAASLSQQNEALAVENRRLAQENALAHKNAALAMENARLAQENMMLRMQQNSAMLGSASTPPWGSPWGGPSSPTANAFWGLNHSPSGSTTAGSGVANSSFNLSDDEVPRTTVMMRHIPNNYTRQMLLDLLDQRGFLRCYDLVYLPIDFKTDTGLGYAFINFASTEEAERFFVQFQGFTKWGMLSEKVCDVSWSDVLQGCLAHVERYRNSPVMHESVPDEFKPMLFSDGTRIPFPGPTKKLRAPRHCSHRESTP